MITTPTVHCAGLEESLISSTTTPTASRVVTLEYQIDTLSASAAPALVGERSRLRGQFAHLDGGDCAVCACLQHRERPLHHHLRHRNGRHIVQRVPQRIYPVAHAVEMSIQAVAI